MSDDVVRCGECGAGIPISENALAVLELDAARERERELIGLLREAHRYWDRTSNSPATWARDAARAIAAFDAREKGQG